jgi:RNA polymerase sigma factor (sigma-70 family)
LQVALLKLHRALGQLKPKDLPEYMGLAAAQIRRTLIDLARHYYGKEGIGQNHATDAAPGQDGLPARVAAAADSADGPEDLAMRAEFHELVEGLPEDQREVIDLTVYHGLEQKEVAELLGISASTVKRRKRDALITLSERLGPEYR